MDQNTKIEALAQDSVFISALADCTTTEDAQRLFATKEISLSGDALLETCLSLLRSGEKSGALSEDDLLQVAAGTSVKMTGYMGKKLATGKVISGKNVAKYSTSKKATT